jgi:hypothetical protein
MLNYKTLRSSIKGRTGSAVDAVSILKRIGIDVTRDGFFKVRPEERTPSCKINKDGSFHDFGSGVHYSDIVSLLYDGYHAFDTLTDTMQWLCQELGIQWEVHHG